MSEVSLAARHIKRRLGRLKHFHEVPHGALVLGLPEITEPGVSCAEALRNFARGILRAIIEDQNLYIAIGLIAQAGQRFFQKIGAVIYGNTYSHLSHLFAPNLFNQPSLLCGISLRLSSAIISSTAFSGGTFPQARCISGTS